MTAKSLTSALSSAAVLALGALALTACQPGATGTAGGAPSAVASGSTSGSGAAPGSAPSSAASHGGTSGGSAAGGTGAGSGSGSSGSASGGDAAGDGYAYKHPCSPQQLSVHVVRRAAAPSQRVIEIRNIGANACGLSYYPLVSLDSAQAANGSQAVRPLVPSGLGGAPAYPVHAGRTVYAVIDLDPSGATTGTVPGVDEINVLPDSDHMPNAATLNFPLGSGTHVLKPKLGLYRDTVADAVASMQTADTPA